MLLVNKVLLSEGVSVGDAGVAWIDHEKCMGDCEHFSGPLCHKINFGWTREENIRCPCHGPTECSCYRHKQDCKPDCCRWDGCRCTKCSGYVDECCTKGCGCTTECSRYTCLVGWHATNGTCAVCPSGTYTPREGMDECEECAVGYYQPHNGSKGCLACPAGTFAPGRGSTACTPCPAGTYSPDEASWDCLPCLLGTACAENATEPRECSAGYYCPQDTPGFIPCPESHSCIKQGMGAPDPCGVCGSTQSGSSRGARVNCSATSEGWCVEFVVNAPACDWTTCSETFAGEMLTVNIESATDGGALCSEAGLCGTMEVALWRGVVGVLVSAATVAVAPGTTRWRWTLTIPRDMERGSDYQVRVKYVVDGGGEHQQGETRSDYFIVWDYFEGMSRKFHAASATRGFNEGYLRDLCDQGLQQTSDPEEIRTVTKQFANLACRCLEKAVETGLAGCDGVSAELAPLGHDDYGKMADEFLAMMSVLEEKQDLNLIKMGIEADQQARAEGRDALGTQLSEYFAKASAETINNNLERSVRELSEQLDRLNEQRRSTAVRILSLAAEHRDLDHYAKEGMKTLKGLVGDFIGDSENLMDKKIAELQDATRQCRRDQDRASLVKTVTDSVKVVVGVVLMFVPGAQAYGVALALDGGLGLAFDEKGDKAADQLVETIESLVASNSTRTKPATSFTDGCMGDNFFEGVRACSRGAIDQISSYWEDIAAGDFKQKIDPKMASKIATYVDSAADVVDMLLTEDSGSCGKVQDLQEEVAKLRQLVSLLKALNLALFNLEYIKNLGEAHSAAVMSGAIYPQNHLLEMKIDLRLVGPQHYVDQIVEKTNLSDDKKLQIKESLAQVYGALRGKLEVEFEYYQLSAHMVDLTDTVLLKRRTLATDLAKNQEVSQFLRQGSVLPENMADAYTIQHALNDGPFLHRWAANDAKVAVNNRIASLQYDCRPFWHECKPQKGTLLSCEDYLCISTHNAKVSQAAACCKERKALLPTTSKTVKVEFDLDKTAFSTRNIFRNFNNLFHRRQLVQLANGTHASNQQPGSEVQMCLLHLGSWADWHLVQHVSLVLLGGEHIPVHVSAIISRTDGGSGAHLLRADNGKLATIAFPKVSWAFEYNSSSCRPLVEPVEADNVQPPLRGCYTAKFTDSSTGKLVDLSGVYAIRFVFKLEMQRGPNEDAQADYASLDGRFQVLDAAVDTNPYGECNTLLHEKESSPGWEVYKTALCVSVPLASALLGLGAWYYHRHAKLKRPAQRGFENNRGQNPHAVAAADAA